MRALIIAGLISLAAMAAQAQEHRDTACAAMDAKLPAEWASWAKAAPLNGALTPGSAATLSLRPSDTVKYVVPPEKAQGAGTSGGLFDLSVDRPGRYAIALGSPAWLDLVRDGKAAADVGHGHGPDCSSIRKYVEFDLTPGRYVLQISGAPSAQTRILAIRR